ncbi:hypothetical protein H4219_006058 [Mycoemilia scoparia]|uniref:Uncharacterized protein n=1 Tax=Mycoemilia scoparia TaxID=417184 RepID=A0A9W7ZUU0_9FUNG|nr:hypothetical protein H4219_006058 [Mycoemilia scoparia]
MKLLALPPAAAGLLCLSTFATADSSKNYLVNNKVLHSVDLKGISIRGLFDLQPTFQVLGNTSGDICVDSSAFSANTTARYHFVVKWFGKKKIKEYDCEIPKGKGQKTTCNIGINWDKPDECGNLLKVVVDSSYEEDTPV